MRKGSSMLVLHKLTALAELALPLSLEIAYLQVKKGSSRRRFGRRVSASGACARRHTGGRLQSLAHHFPWRSSGPFPSRSSSTGAYS